jgi:hypothetical protein
MICIADARNFILYDFCIRPPTHIVDARVRSRDLLCDYPLDDQTKQRKVIEYVVETWFPKDQQRPKLQVVK